MNFKAIIFDLDGTLLDSLEDIADSANTILARFGYPGHDLHAYKYFVGEGMENLIRKALPEDKRSEESVAKCLAAMQQEYAKRCEDKTRPYDGIPELLKELEDKGVRIAVLSNKPHEATITMISRLLPGYNFQPIIGAGNEFPKKPAPDGALAISGKLGIDPANIAFLGDSQPDMKTAAAANMFPVGCLWGFRTADELLAAGAKILIKDPFSLLPWL